MLKADTIPTPLVSPDHRPAVTIVDLRRPARLPALSVALRLLWWGATMLWVRVTRRGSPSEYGRRFRLLLEDLGGLWIKLGQLLSLRADLFSFEFCRELSRLQVKAVGFPPEEAMRILEADLGGSLRSYFSEFEETAHAAASMGQVHLARLRDSGVRVAIKVQRPNLPWTFTHQLRVIRWIVWAIQFARFRPHMRWSELIWELDQIMHGGNGLPVRGWIDTADPPDAQSSRHLRTKSVLCDAASAGDRVRRRRSDGGLHRHARLQSRSPEIVARRKPRSTRSWSEGASPSRFCGRSSRTTSITATCIRETSCFSGTAASPSSISARAISPSASIWNAFGCRSRRSRRATMRRRRTCPCFCAGRCRVSTSTSFVRSSCRRCASGRSARACASCRITRNRSRSSTPSSSGSCTTITARWNGRCCASGGRRKRWTHR